MTSDPEIFRAAKQLIAEHGKYAPHRAAKRADELFAAGDVDGSVRWRQILAAVKALRRGGWKGDPAD